MKTEVMNDADGDLVLIPQTDGDVRELARLSKSGYCEFDPGEDDRATVRLRRLEDSKKKTKKRPRKK